ncbi:MAG: FkbM family methyltransferase [Planctomycetota bacterium]|jgi:FkbM family methyltransferase
MKRIIKLVVGYFGYEIVKKSSFGANSAFTAKRIRLLGNPKTIIDVGVAQGTFSLYDAFRNRNIVLVDPLLDKSKIISNKINQTYPNVYLVAKAAGEKKDKMNFSFETNSPGKSSLLQRTTLTKEKSGTNMIKVEVCRLDEIISELNLPGPYGLKIDSEGYELKVLMGAEGIFVNLDFVIIEVNIAKRFEGSYSFEEMIIYMHDRGFQVTDMLDFGRPDPVGTRFLDLVFKKRRPLAT